jgi:FAD/FMN-containing dehydrogenase
MAVGGEAWVLRPRKLSQVGEVMAEVQDKKASLALRGAGCSYGDAANNTGGYVLDLSRLDRIHEFDAVRGIARVEPGVTFRDLWRLSLRHGYWPPVVPGTMDVTIGGAAAMNIHGKNNYKVGTLGEHVTGFRLMTPSGESLTCSREENTDVFHAAISGFGMLGCFTELTLQLKKVYSGRLRVVASPTRNLQESLALLEDLGAEADYLVGWLDLHGKGRALGRGTMHRADQIPLGEDLEGERMLDHRHQAVPSRLFGVVPRSWLWRPMWLAAHCGGIPLVNYLKYRAGFGAARRSPHLQSHAAFHFLLDYVPRWKWAFRPGGLVQFQPFVPRMQGHRVLTRLIEMCHEARLVPYLGVLKRHRPDPFLMTHSLDGYSLAMDFSVSRDQRRRGALWEHCQRMAEFVLEAGGRFYYAKDAVLLASSLGRIHGDEAVSRFRALKARLDPENLLQTDLSRRMGL